MGLKVHVIKRKILAGMEAGKEKFYGQVRMMRELPLEIFCQRAAADSSATPGDVEMVLNSLLEVIAFNLQLGQSIDLGDFGNMRLSAGSCGVEKEDKFHGRMMRRPRVIFTPGKLLQRMLKNVAFEWLAERVIDERELCEEAHE